MRLSACSLSSVLSITIHLPSPFTPFALLLLDKNIACLKLEQSFECRVATRVRKARDLGRHQHVQPLVELVPTGEPVAEECPQ